MSKIVYVFHNLKIISSKEQQNGEQSLQNNFWSLAADIKRPEKQPIVFEGRQDKNIKD